MAEARYYWLKMPKDFFSLPAIRYLRSLSLGGDFVLLYLQLLIESTDKGGKLRLTDEVPYTWETLSGSIGMPLETVSEGMKLLTALGLVEILPDDTIYLPEQAKLTQSEAASTKRSRDKRERDALQNAKEKSPVSADDTEEKQPRGEEKCKSKPLHCNAAEAVRNGEKEKEKETDTDTETEKEKEAKENKKERAPAGSPARRGAKGNVFLDMLKEENRG